LTEFYSGATDRLGCLTEGFCLRRLQPIHVRGHAVANTFWIGLAAPSHPTSNVVSGLIDPHGIVVAECPAGSGSTIAVADIRPIEISQIGRVFRSRTRARSVDVVA
jgi:hypothetical protein